IAKLFLGGTAPLADAAGELGDWTETDFESGDEIAEYLRSRGLIRPDSAGPVSLDQLAGPAEFRGAGRLALGPFGDLAARLLDALELFYELYDEEPLAGDAAAGVAEGHGASSPPAT